MMQEIFIGVSPRDIVWKVYRRPSDTDETMLERVRVQRKRLRGLVKQHGKGWVMSVRK